MALNNYAVLYLQIKEYDNAIASLRQVEAEIDSVSMPFLFLTKGKTFMAMGEMDSAAYFYEKLESVLSHSKVKAETKASAYGALSGFSEKQGNYYQALKYQSQREKILGQIMDEREQKSTYLVQQKYDYEALQNAMNKKLARTQRIITIGIVLLLSVVALFLFRSSQRNKREASQKRGEKALKAHK